MVKGGLAARIGAAAKSEHRARSWASLSISVWAFG
jgi:hypothetical protein